MMMITNDKISIEHIYVDIQMAKYAYLGAPIMVKWGVPEKILQNVVQTRCS